jgi:hypothetical protein
VRRLSQIGRGKNHWLNGVAIALASLTLVSVSVDAYNFIREDQALISDRVQRAITLGEFVVSLCYSFRRQSGSSFGVLPGLGDAGSIDRYWLAQSGHFEGISGSTLSQARWSTR